LGCNKGIPSRSDRSLHATYDRFVIEMTTIRAELQSLEPSAIIELFQFDLTTQGGDIVYFHNGINSLGNDVVFDGVTYSQFPIKAEGFKKSATGSLPRPTVTVSNVGGYMGALARQYGDFAGCKLTRIRTFARFLDSVNFSSGNPSADPTQILPKEIWYVDRKSNEDANTMTYELSASIDMVSVKIPRRQFIQNCCTWVYRGADCGYTGTNYFDISGNQVSSASSDACGKRLTDCKLRFGDTAVLPFGGFPGCGLVTQ